jgi:hypothetical protein
VFFVISEGLVLIFDVLGLFGAVQKMGIGGARMRAPAYGISWVKHLPPTMKLDNVHSSEPGQFPLVT